MRSLKSGARASRVIQQGGKGTPKDLVKGIFLLAELQSGHAGAALVLLSLAAAAGALSPAPAQGKRLDLVLCTQLAM